MSGTSGTTTARRNSKAWRSWDWPEAPALLEEDYNLEDALFTGGLLNEFIRRSDRVKIACVAQLVNVIAPVRTETGGRAWRTSIYYPYQFASLYGRGAALNVAVDAPTYACEVAQDVSYLDVAAVDNTGEGMVTVFILNRHLTEAMELDMGILGLDSTKLEKHLTIGGEGRDLREANTADQPDRVKPRDGSGLGVEDGRLVGSLPPLSYHVVRLRCA